MNLNPITVLNERNEKKTVDRNIQVESDHKKFTRLKYNREVNAVRVRKMVKSLEEENLLDVNPILVTPVNGKHAIIDGQTREAATAILGLPVPYISLDAAGLREIIILNANLTKWELNDYLHAYMMLNNKNYIRLHEFKEEYGLSLMKAISVLEYNFDDTQLRDRFKVGNFTIVDYEKSEEFASFYNELKKHVIDTSWASRDFFRAVAKIFNKVDRRKFLEKLKKHDINLKRQADLKSYLFQFDTAWNYHKSRNVQRLI